MMSDSENLRLDGDTHPSESTATTLSKIWVLCALPLLGWFAWPALQIELLAVFQSITPEQLRLYMLLAYIASWLIAMPIDLLLHKNSYRGPIKERNVVATAAGIGILLVLLAIL